jgi:hypothetical protein
MVYGRHYIEAVEASPMDDGNEASRAQLLSLLS